jgi:multiple sugar transport system permease protein
VARVSAIARLFQRRESVIPALVGYTLLTLFAIVVAGPLIFALLGAFRPIWDLKAIPPTIVPTEWMLGNFQVLFERFPIGRMYLNSLFTTSAIVTGQVLSSAVAGYILGKFEFPGRDVVFFVILWTMMIPFFVTVVPLFVMTVRWGWMDTYQGLIVPHLFSSFGVFLFRQFVHTIPDELLDAARVDGAGEVRIFVQVVMPLLLPAIGALAIFTFIWNWGSFFWPLLITNETEMRTIPVALATLIRQPGMVRVGGAAGLSEEGIALAGDAIAFIPVLTVFFLFQRYITEGVTLTGLTAT